LAAPVLTEASQAANFTNELGAGRTVRYLRNVMGLWLLSECQRTWRAAGLTDDLASLLRQAAALPAGQGLIEADDEAVLAPGDMPARIAAGVRAAGGRVPTTPGEVVRCIIDSLAAAYATAIDQARDLAGQRVERIHVVGGGSQNELLCQATADATGLPLEAGPIEASAIGNALIQAQALGMIGPDLAQLRTIVAGGFPRRRYQPGEPRPT
jgi:rhamnulokinase